MAKQVQTHAEFLDLIQSPLMIVDFTASWCGPCKVVKPIYNVLSTLYPGQFLVVDVDALQETAAMCGVSAMPTFQVFRNGSKIDEIKGADPNALKALVQRHFSASNESSDLIDPVCPVGMINLAPFLTKKSLEALNINLAHPISNLLTSEGKGVVSDVDEQIILCFPFSQIVKLHSLKITLKQNLGGSGPKTVKTYVNRSSTLAFDNNSGDIETVIFTENDLLPESMPKNLRFVKYQNVVHLTLFVVDNQAGSEITEISEITFYGSTSENTKPVA